MKHGGNVPVRLDTTPDTYVLFLDMAEVEELDNVEQCAGRATKHPANPVLQLGDVDSFDSRRAANWASSLIYDRDDHLFKAWYFGCDLVHWAAIGYAESEDGVLWRKPVLDMYPYKGRSDNNICFCIGDGETSHFEANKDYSESRADRRFQALAHCGNNEYFALYSEDGKKWRRNEKPVTFPSGDTGHFFYDDGEPDPGKRVKVYGQHTGGFGPDIEHLTPLEHKVIDPADGREREIHFVYVIPYRGYYVMFYDFNLWREYFGLEGYIDNRRKHTRGEQGGVYIGDIRLAVSRNGLGTFDRILPNMPVVARGERGVWDSGFLILGGGSGIVVDDEINIFYTGITERGGAGFIGPVVPETIQLGLAKLRLDGFTYLTNRDGLSDGTVTTVEIEVGAVGSSSAAGAVSSSPSPSPSPSPARTRLTVNASHLLPYRDWIEVEVLDAGTGIPVPGYGRAECIDVLRDSVRTEVEWNGHRTLDGVHTKKIKLRFYLYGRARLYSYTFAED